jgi:hypothetical protein
MDQTNHQKNIVIKRHARWGGLGSNNILLCQKKPSQCFDIIDTIVNMLVIHVNCPYHSDEWVVAHVPLVYIDERMRKS